MERRRYYRVQENDVNAFIVGNDGAATYPVKNLSQGGLLLRGSPPIPTNTDIRLLLSAPGFKSTWLDARVLRKINKTGTQDGLALEFNYLNDDDQDLISEMVFRYVIQHQSPVVLLSNTRNKDAKALSRVIQNMGYLPIVVNTPLCMIRHLSTRGNKVKAVVLGTSAGITSFVEMGAFLSEAYPEMRKILIARSRWHMRYEVMRLFDTIVHKPWTEKWIADALSEED